MTRQPPEGPRALVVIVNYRSAALTVECLRSLQPQVLARPGTRVAVVENCSGDGSARAIGDAIAAHGWNWAELLAAPVNGGFAYGNNLAIRHALRGEAPPDLVWLLNPDTVVHPGALDALVEFMQSHPRAGIAGSGLDDADGQPWPYAFRFPSLWSELDHGLRLGPVTRLLRHRVVPRRMSSEHPARVDWLPGASMMVRRELLTDVGLMDEGYFLYFEETDFCLQAHRAGWECWYVPASRVQHIAGQSTGVTSRKDEPTPMPSYWFDSRRRYFVKNHGRLYACVADVLWAAAFASWRVRRRLQRKPDQDPPGLLRDFLRHSACFHAGLPANDAVRPRADAAPASTSANA